MFKFLRYYSIPFICDMELVNKTETAGVSTYGNVSGTTLVCVSIGFALVIFVLLVLIFSNQLSFWLRSTMRAIRSALSAGYGGRGDYLMDDDDLEHLDGGAAPSSTTGLAPGDPNASNIGIANSNLTGLPAGETYDLP